MLNNILLAAAVSIPVNPLCAPVLAEEITSPKEVPAAFAGMSKPAAFGAFTGTSDTPPTMALYSTSVTNNIACRNAARSKFFELGAKNMSSSNENAQWGTIGTNMRALVWCRETQVIIAVTGYNYNSVSEARDEIVKAF